MSRRPRRYYTVAFSAKVVWLPSREKESCQSVSISLMRMPTRSRIGRLAFAGRCQSLWRRGEKTGVAMAARDVKILHAKIDI